ncbi:hypothetical protein FSP39_021364 [Pinctada imbricata]|uniref:Fucolectin tachylectin-4 pentraxin-1 domain-containing protein n=1 Tax=Pinctada imbricata TaxID=66713 RepID=A0AA89C557_PINIB|nr:hypothetical protein FSP39_021364 [Pinctada imbricata]
MRSEHSTFNAEENLSSTQNVAFKKRAFQSSILNGPSFAENAVDDIFGDFWDCASTDFEDRPYWYVDLDSYYEIQQVEILNRADCCPERLHDVDVTVAGCNEDFHMLCGTFEGPGTASERVVLECPKGTIGRYVKLQITKGINNILSICEVKVIGK